MSCVFRLPCSADTLLFSTSICLMWPLYSETVHIAPDVYVVSAVVKLGDLVAGNVAVK